MCICNALVTIAKRLKISFLGEYKVTLAIYSGRPDPVWTIHPRHEFFKEMKEHLDNARATGNTYRLKHMPPKLGYKGFLVHPLTQMMSKPT